MLDLKPTWDQLISDLERERDELRVKVHLGKADARDAFAKLERKLEGLRGRARQILGAAQDSAGHVQDSVKAVVDEIRLGFKRIRDLV
jgi:hypothetical protein